MNDLKDIIKQRREELGLTMEQVAAACGVSRPTVSRWESGEIKDVRREKIIALAKVLRVAPTFLLGYADGIEQSDISDNNESTVGQRIRNMRKERKMTLDYVASKIGISKQTLSRYERGIITNIPSDKIEAIAEVFNVPPAWIMGWKTEKVPPIHKPITAEENNESYADLDGNSFGEKLRRLRMERDLSVDMLVEDLNDRFILDKPFHKSMIYRWEKGDNDPSLEHAKCLCVYFNISMDYLAGLTDIRTPAKLLARKSK